MEKRIIIFLSLMTILGLFYSSLALAESNIEITPIKNLISPNDQALFQVKITNQLSEVQRYTLYSFAQGWTVDPTPLKDKIVELRPGNSYTVTIQARPQDSFPPGIYHLSLTVESDHGERYEEALKVYLGAEQPLGYLPSVVAVVDMDEKINPQQPVSIKVFLENRNPLDLSNLKVSLESDIPEFMKEATIDLPPLEKKTVEFSITPSPYQQPRDYYLFFVFEHKGQTIKVLDHKIEILPLVPNFTISEVKDSVFLKVFTSLEVLNPGNVLNTQTIKYPVTFLDSLVTFGDVQTVVEDGQRYLVWELSLNPGEKKTLDFVINYRLLLYLLIVAALLTVLYLYVQSPLVVKKSVHATKHDSDGALSEIKIVIEVRNKSSKPVKNLRVIDLVPGIANVQKNLDLGTLTPQEIKHTHQGTKVIWAISELEGHEHRIITYKITARLNILGPISLPRAVVEYGQRKGKIGKAYSNVFHLGK